MSREVNNESCTAWVIMGTAQNGAVIPCRALGEGYCLRDRRVEEGLANVAVATGICLADAQEEVAIDNAGLAPVVEDIRSRPESLGARLVLDAILDEQE